MDSYLQGYNWRSWLNGAESSLRRHGVLMLDVSVTYSKAVPLNVEQRLDILEQAVTKAFTTISRSHGWGDDVATLLMIHLDDVTQDGEVVVGGGVVRINGLALDDAALSKLGTTGRNATPGSLNFKVRDGQATVQWLTHMTRGAIGWLGCWENIVEDAENTELPHTDVGLLTVVDEIFHLLNVDVLGNVGAYELTRACCLHTSETYLAQLALESNQHMGSVPGDIKLSARETLNTGTDGDGEAQARRGLLSALSEDEDLDNVVELMDRVQIVLGE